MRRFARNYFKTNRKGIVEFIVLTFVLFCSANGRYFRSQRTFHSQKSQIFLLTSSSSSRRVYLDLFMNTIQKLTVFFPLAVLEWQPIHPQTPRTLVYVEISREFCVDNYLLTRHTFIRRTYLHDPNAYTIINIAPKMCAAMAISSSANPTRATLTYTFFLYTYWWLNTSRNFVRQTNKTFHWLYYACARRVRPIYSIHEWYPVCPSCGWHECFACILYFYGVHIKY